jgi:6-phosphogluconolactonase
MNIIVENNVAELLASKLSKILTDAIIDKGSATVVISGGSTPKQMLIKLFSIKLDWQKVTVYFSDERYVANTHKDSNYNMLNDCLIKADLVTKRPTLVSYFQEHSTIEKAIESLENKLSELKKFDAVVIGMGLDGHFASLFPDDEQLVEKLSLDGHKNCCIVRTKSSPYTRISLTLACLLRTDNFFLLISGEEKLQVLKQAEKGLEDDNFQMPITALYQTKIANNKIQVYCQR